MVSRDLHTLLSPAVCEFEDIVYDGQLIVLSKELKHFEILERFYINNLQAKGYL